MNVLVTTKSINVTAAVAVVNSPMGFDLIQPEAPKAEIKLTNPMI